MESGADGTRPGPMKHSRPTCSPEHFSRPRRSRNAQDRTAQRRPSTRRIRPTPAVSASKLTPANCGTGTAFFTGTYRSPRSCGTAGSTLCSGTHPGKCCKLNELEFFAARAPQHCQPSWRSSQEGDSRISSETDPELWKDYQRALREMAACNAYCRSSGPLFAGQLWQAE